MASDRTYYRFLVRWPAPSTFKKDFFTVDVRNDGTIKTAFASNLIKWDLGSTRFDPKSLHEGHARRLTVDFIDPGFDTVVPYASLTMFIESSQVMVGGFDVPLDPDGTEVEDGDA